LEVSVGPISTALGGSWPSAVGSVRSHFLHIATFDVQSIYKEVVFAERCPRWNTPPRDLPPVFRGWAGGKIPIQYRLFAWLLGLKLHQSGDSSGPGGTFASHRPDEAQHRRIAWLWGL
jgi:hypothetical protein